MQKRPFKQVDVFTATPYLGNPVAVVLDASGLSDEAMAAFARWTNLSETTFVLPPTEAGRAGGADYRLRIFTPGGELPFAGHPTLGTCHAWLEHSGSTKTTLVQECGVGLVQIARSQEGGMQRLAFAAPPCKRSNPSPALLAQVATALGLKEAQVQAAQLLDNGPVWLGVLVDSAQTVLALAPDHAQLKGLGQKVGVVHVDRASSAIKNGANELAPSVTVRAFAAPIGVNEDPVTGSLNASLAQWLMADGLAPARYVAAQGECLGRAGRVHVERDAGGQVWVGGVSVTCVDGRVAL
jgi:PhzF family phenazine biosynthesis protein